MIYFDTATLFNAKTAKPTKGFKQLITDLNNRLLL